VTTFAAPAASSISVLAEDRPTPPAAESGATIDTIKCHSNLIPAGVLKDGILTLHLVIGEGTWYPEAEGREPSLQVLAFGEESGPLTNPGPLLRVPEGTELRVSVRNKFTKKVYVHGLHDRPGDPKDFFALDPGESRELQFRSGPVGTYDYWASVQDGPIFRRLSLDSQLTGALVVDPPGAEVRDRIFLIGYWRENLVAGGKIFQGTKQVLSVNGKSWPWDERLQYRVREEVRWRWINSSGFPHPMHLHGAYFRVDSSGDGEADRTYSPAEQRTEVTENMAPGAIMTLTWIPPREGQWLFHCHFLFHMSRHGTLGYQITSLDHSTDPSDLGAGMSGLIVGINVLPSQTLGHPSPSHQETKPKQKARHLTLELNWQGTLVHIFLREASRLIGESRDAMGPPLILVRGQPVEITVENRLPEPTAIHWHGIELESYFDGVPGWDKDQHGVAPAIGPGESFVAKMAPPRAGTFIYRTHWHDVEQLTSGLYGPLIVVEPGQKYNSETDKIFLVSRGGPSFLNDPLLINGSAEPPTMKLRAGTVYRFRFINICPDEITLPVSLVADGKPVQWRALAKDGTDLPAQQATLREAKFNLGVGETYDFEFKADAKTVLTLQAKGETQKRTATLEVE
jgi:FtsP/CotA-like multicopper oxidase with cupredoxin domain